MSLLFFGIALLKRYIEFAIICHSQQCSIYSNLRELLIMVCTLVEGENGDCNTRASAKPNQ